MSLVSHDSTFKCHKVKYDPRDDAIKKKKTRASETEVFEETEKDNYIIKGLKRNNHNNVAESNNFKNKDTNVDNCTKEKSLLINHITNKAEIRDNIAELVENTSLLDTKNRRYCKNADCTKYSDTGDNGWLEISSNKGITLGNFALGIYKKDKTIFTKQEYSFREDDIQKTSRNSSRKADHSIQIKTQYRKNKHSFYKNNSTSNALKRVNDKYKRKISCRLNSGVLISLIMLNVSGLSSASDASSFSSALTSRMIASFLGYPSTCTVGAEVRPCTLTLSCWLRGGTRLRGCGGWLFSCCGLPEQSRDTFDNSIPSSEWKYKPPTKLRQVPQRNMVPNNVFRRRVDDDVTQLECGLPSSRILQKRIIGGREARFAEFPWQAHVRISEFQCGGVLVSRRYVATAAHCVSRAHTRDIAVWLGAVDTSATHHPARKLGVIQKILHPLFQFRMTQPDRYDIALLKLSRPITYMPHILPICLPDYDMELRGRSGVIAGWGKTDASSGHTGTNILRSANVPILSKEQCINWHQSKQISVEIHSEMICAGHPDGHQDACLGDSGGPLIVLDNGRYYLVGITSAGFGCGVDHQPGIYHNVKLTANWIRSVISPPVSYNDNYLN